MRILNIVKTSLVNDKLVLEEELERTINNKTLETDERVATIKTLLGKIATTDLCFSTFTDLMESEKEEELKQNQNNNK